MPRSWLVLAIVTCLSAVILGSRLNRGWVPHDEGSLAQSAERVLAGEMPHRDFDEPYTGGLSDINALAFRILGTNLVSLRVALLLGFIAWVPALYYVAVHFTSPVGAAAAVLSSVVWSVPTYPAPVPSWYNLFFAVFGVAALLRHLDTGRTRWLVVAGVAGGLSCLAKIVGLYYVAGALLFLAFREQCVIGASSTEPRDRGRGYSWALTVSVLGLVAVLVALVHTRWRVADVAHYVVPGAALAGLVLWSEWARPRGASRERLATLWRLVGPFALGVTVPVALYAVPYVLSGSLGSLVRGVFVLPTKRLGAAAMEPFALGTSIAALPLVVGFALAARGSAQTRKLAAWLAVVALAPVLVACLERDVYLAVWRSVRPLVPILVLGGAVILARAGWVGGPSVPLRGQQVFLVLSVTAFCSVLQFPFSAPIYFCYIAPLVVLSGLAVCSAVGTIPALFTATVVIFYGLFAVRAIYPGFIYNMGVRYERDDQDSPLALERGGLRVSGADVEQYESLVAAVRRHSRGEFVYATPDCPEIYFLSGKRNPTRTIFDFFDEPAGRTARVLQDLRTHRVDVVIINHAPGFSGPPPPALAAALTARFPQSVSIGRFEVRWAE